MSDNYGQTIESEVMDRQHQDEGVGDVLGWDSLEGARTPAELAELKEAAELVAGLSQREVDGLRGETLTGMISYFLRDFNRNPDPADVGRKVIALAKFFNHRAVAEWSITHLAKACGESPAAMSDRVRRDCNQLIEAGGGVAQAKWQQTPGQREVSADAQRGNNNRIKNAAKGGRVTLADRKIKRG